MTIHRSLAALCAAAIASVPFGAGIITRSHWLRGRNEGQKHRHNIALKIRYKTAVHRARDVVPLLNAPDLVRVEWDCNIGSAARFGGGSLETLRGHLCTFS